MFMHVVSSGFKVVVTAFLLYAYAWCTRDAIVAEAAQQF